MGRQFLYFTIVLFLVSGCDNSQKGSDTADGWDISENQDKIDSHIEIHAQKSFEADGLDTDVELDCNESDSSPAILTISTYEGMSPSALFNNRRDGVTMKTESGGLFGADQFPVGRFHVAGGKTQALRASFHFQDYNNRIRANLERQSVQGIFPFVAEVGTERGVGTVEVPSDNPVIQQWVTKCLQNQTH